MNFFDKCLFCSKLNRHTCNYLFLQTLNAIFSISQEQFKKVCILYAHLQEKFGFIQDTQKQQLLR